MMDGPGNPRKPNPSRDSAGAVRPVDGAGGCERGELLSRLAPAAGRLRGCSRRWFLASLTGLAAGAGAGCGLLRAESAQAAQALPAPKTPQASPTQPTSQASPALPALRDPQIGAVRTGGLVRLTTRGRVFIASDFHGRFGDFQQWLRATRIIERIADGEDVYGILLGDVVDTKSGHPRSDDNGDVRILQALREARTKLGKLAPRLILILGNHEHDVLAIYEKLKREPDFDPHRLQPLLERLYGTAKGAYYRQFNFLQRITPELYEDLRQLPVAVQLANGVVAIHGGPSAALESLDDIVQMNPRVVQELVWSRPGAGRDSGYTPDDVAAFLARIKADLMLSGHTPLPLLPEDLRRDGIVTFAGRQVILGTSYGALPGKKSYLIIDQMRRYRDTDELKPGREILPLEEAQEKTREPGGPQRPDDTDGRPRS